MILAIDVGLRNLAMCVMSGSNSDVSTFQIHLWDNFNTLDCDEHTCTATLKNGKTCGKCCTYKYSSDQSTKPIFCCKTHFPKDVPMTARNVHRKKNVDQYLLQELADIVLQRLQEIYDTHKELFQQLQGIVIELQPKINQKMKFTSHIIYGKLVELFRGTKCTIRFVPASRKLKAYTGPTFEGECPRKGEYAKRKWLSVQYVKWFLEEKFSKSQRDKWLPTLLDKKKQDDAADTLLMTINAILGTPSAKPKKEKETKAVQETKASRATNPKTKKSKSSS